VALPLLPFALRMDGFGPPLTLDQARHLPIMQAGGSVAYFEGAWWHDLLCGKRAGLLVVGPACEAARALGDWAVGVVALAGAAFTFGLPFLLWQTAPERRRSLAWPLRLLAASVVLFAAAHALSFALHLPGRYSQVPGFLVLGIGLGLGADRLLSRVREAPRRPARLMSVAAGLALVALPFLQPALPMMNYKQGHAGALYRYLRGDSAWPGTVATLSEEGGFLPAFAGRSVVAARQFLVPYSTGYFAAMDARARDLLTAHAATEPAALADFVARYAVAYALVEDGTWTPARLAASSWAADYPLETAALGDRLAAGELPLLARRQVACAVLRDPPFTLVDAACAAGLRP
jgi:hypothetical protein